MKKSINELFFILLILLQLIHVLNYPIFPTILTISIPISEDDSKSRVENNYVRWLQASGADIISVHPWTSNEEIDYLLTKVNGILFQGNPDTINIESAYYKIAKYLFLKVIELYDSGVKMPLISIGDDVSLLSAIISEDDISIISELEYKIIEPSNLNLYKEPENTILFSEFEKEDMKALEEEYILPNNLKRFVSIKNFISDFHLSEKFDVIATSKTEDGKEYISIAEGKKYPIIMVTFHPEYVVFETGKESTIPETLHAIYTSRFIGNGFVFYGRKNVMNTFTIEEKEKFCYIDPYGEFPQLIQGRYNYIFENENILK